MNDWPQPAIAFIGMPSNERSVRARQIIEHSAPPDVSAQVDIWKFKKSQSAFVRNAEEADIRRSLGHASRFAWKRVRSSLVS